MNPEIRKRGMMGGGNSAHLTPALSPARRGSESNTAPATPAEQSGDRRSEGGGGYDELLTKGELAAKLKVAVRTVENWTRDGYLPVVKVSTVARFYWPVVVKHLLAKYQVCRRDDGEGSK